MSIAVRGATPADTALLFSLVTELAEYERLAQAVRTSEEDLARLLFDEPPGLHAMVVEADGEVVGFALWYYSVSSFEGPGLYLEDLFVSPQARGKGAGLALLKALARRCAAEGLRRMEWAVLEWNRPAIAFYDSLGAKPMKDWILTRLSGDALRRLARD